MGRATVVTSDNRRVLLVPDSLYWATATIAREIARHNPQFDFEIRSEPVLKSILRRFEDYSKYFDIVHFLTPATANRLAGAFVGDTAVVTTLHHIETEACTTSLEACDAIMTGTTQWVRELKRLGLPGEQIVQVPYGVDTKIFRPPTATEREEVRGELGFSSEQFLVGYCANRSGDKSGRKRSEVFETALKRLAGSEIEVGAVIMGPGWQDFAREQTAAGLRCRHLPYEIAVDGLARWYRALDVFWVTSRIEGGPLPLLEAMATGLPCVTTAVGIPIDTIVDGKNGLLVPFDDPHSLCSSSLRIAEDSALRASLGREARATVVDQCQWSLTMPKAADLYHVAVRRFEERASTQAAARHRTDAGNYLSGRWHRRMEAREHFLFSRRLLRTRDYAAASVLAQRALRTDKRDPKLWWNAAWVRVFPMLKQLRSRWGRKSPSDP